MATVLAIQLTHDEASFVTARTEPGEPITVLGLSTVPLHGAPPSEPAVGQSEDGAPHPEEHMVLRPELPDSADIDSTIGMIHSKHVLYNILELPFRDPRKIEQVAGHQIQDLLPFDLDDFVVDSVVSGEASENRFRVLSSILPKEEVARSLAVFDSFGTEPRVITTGAAALAALAGFCEPNATGLHAYIEFTSRRTSLAVLFNGAQVHLRDFITTESSSGSTEQRKKEIYENIACSLARVEQDLGMRIDLVHVIGLLEYCTELEKVLPYRLQALDLSQKVVNESADEIHLEDIVWSLGLVASDMAKGRRSERHLLDFRQGQFAFHRAWQDIWNALQQEMFYIILFLLLGIGWYGGKIYSSYSALSEVDSRMNALTEQYFGAGVPYRGEITFLQTKLDELQEELRGLGSLASLSPLQALLELSTALGTGMDISLDSVNIGASHLVLRGSVAENRLVADLSAALKARHDRFCDVRVDNKGKTGSSRVGFSAEITLCD
ncbi:MAG: hypothetical protein U0136_04695 [Bdellovibrionota bacterium]